MKPPSGEGFPKSQRLRTRPEFLRVQRRGRRVELRHLVVAYLPGPVPCMRVGLTVSRKVGNAVVRNRVKRALRESLRRGSPGSVRALERLSQLDIVFIARSTAGGASGERLAAEVAEAVRRIAAAQR